MTRTNLGAAAALDLPALGVRPDEGDALRRRQREQGVVVLQQHRGGDRGAADELAGLGRLVGGLGGVALAHLAPGEQLEQPADRLVDARLGDLAVAHRLQQALATLDRRSGHLQVEPGLERRGRAVRTEPVAEHHAVEAEVVAQHTAQQRLVVARVRPVDPVVRRHHRLDVGAALVERGDGGLERHEVQLAQRAFVDLAGDRHPLELGVVGDEVLDARGHPLGLQAAHVADGDARREVRVLAHALEVASADRRAMQVDGGGEDDVGPLAQRLTAERPTDLLDQLRIERRPERGAAGERRRRRPLPRRAAHPGRPVAAAQRRYPRQLHRVPRVAARPAATPSAPT